MKTIIVSDIHLGSKNSQARWLSQLLESDFDRLIVNGDAINNLDSSTSIAATLVELQLDNLGIDYIKRRAALIDAVTLAHVRAEARKLLSVDPAIMVIGPPLVQVAGSGKG